MKFHWKRRKYYKQGLSVIVNAFGWVLPETDLENQIVEIPENVQNWLIKDGKPKMIRIGLNQIA